MFDKNKALKIFLATLAPMTSAVVAIFFSKIDPNASVVLVGLVFLAAWAGLYLALKWLFIDRPAALEAKYPVTAEEHRQRREEFHNWLERH
jgi:Co/Zn/Cd efflux system component